MTDRKLLVVGLDCAPPEIVFDRRDELPVLKGLMEKGLWGKLRSSDPPITIPAWMVMATGLDPGRLGLYGFRHRRGYAYDQMWIANSKAVKDMRVWDYIGEAGGTSTLVSVPPSYPPYPVAGNLVSCFITPPGPGKETTWPPALKAEIEERFGPYIFDVVFRTDDRDEILRQIYAMTDQRFEVMEWLMEAKPWNLFWFVEIGVDRVHHAFWKYMDREHHLYEPGNRFETAIIDYYKHLDGKIGRLLDKAGPDAAVLVVSDHGAKRMKGAFCVNEWLIDKGWLAVKERPSKPVSLDDLAIDWERTRAWAWGGYYARVFLNVEGREPKGVIPAGDYEKVREELLRELEGVRGPAGEAWATKVIKPQEHYEVLEGEYPDLMVYFDDLYWRSAGTLGHGTMYLPENDTGPDDAVHAQHGIYILSDPAGGRTGRRDGDILDIAPTVLDLMGLGIPNTMKGRVLRRE
ncbi:MAG: alkaline phosphatase family protein [Candidatus Aminicenantes bacterium]|nr:alkaline phosphatase family protein [Candidatus Aminicenantes bacterium]NLH77190.1 nucleotide pyrophosphatase [Acidobacteriota bacterium]